MRCEYGELGAVEAVLARNGDALRGIERRFEPNPELALRVLRSRAEALAATLVEATAGRAQVELKSCE